jgi:hypothetical protein
MRTPTAWIICCACLLASTAHADDGKPVALVVGGALGAESQEASDGRIDENAMATSMSLVELHAGASLLHGWIEPAVDVELGQGSGTRSFAGFLDLRVHFFPHWRVHPTLLAGYGTVVDNGTGAMDEHTGARASALGGPGLEVRIDSHWTVTGELRLLLVGGESFDVSNHPSTLGYFVAHGVLGDASAEIGVTYRF